MLLKLLEFGFKYAGTIDIDNSGKLVPVVSVKEFCENSPQVYAWEQNGEIIYIGKGTNGIKKRHGEHKNGWNGGSKPGLIKAEKLKLLIVNNGSIKVYAYKCDTFIMETKMFGDNVSAQFSWMDKAEQILIGIFKPILNVNGKK